MIVVIANNHFLSLNGAFFMLKIEILTIKRLWISIFLIIFALRYYTTTIKYVCARGKYHYMR